MPATDSRSDPLLIADSALEALVNPWPKSKSVPNQQLFAADLLWRSDFDNQPYKEDASDPDLALILETSPGCWQSRKISTDLVIYIQTH